MPPWLHLLPGLLQSFFCRDTGLVSCSWNTPHPSPRPSFALVVLCTWDVCSSNDHKTCPSFSSGLYAVMPFQLPDLNLQPLALLTLYARHLTLSSNTTHFPSLSYPLLLSLLQSMLQWSLSLLLTDVYLEQCLGWSRCSSNNCTMNQ